MNAAQPEMSAPTVDDLARARRLLYIVAELAAFVLARATFYISLR